MEGSYGILCDNKMPICLKPEIYRTTVRPIALYGTECWTSSRSADYSLHIIEMRMLQRTMVISFLDHVNRLAGVGSNTLENVVGNGDFVGTDTFCEYQLDNVINLPCHLNVDGKKTCGRPKMRCDTTVES